MSKFLLFVNSKKTIPPKWTLQQGLCKHLEECSHNSHATSISKSWEETSCYLKLNEQELNAGSREMFRLHLMGALLHYQSKCQCIVTTKADAMPSCKSKTFNSQERHVHGSNLLFVSNKKHFESNMVLRTKQNWESSYFADINKLILAAWLLLGATVHKMLLFIPNP